MGLRKGCVEEGEKGVREFRVWSWVIGDFAPGKIGVLL